MTGIAMRLPMRLAALFAALMFMLVTSTFGYAGHGARSFEVVTPAPGGDAIAYAILSGDPGVVDSLSEENRLVAQFILEVIEESLDQLALMDHYQAGQVCGIITAETGAFLLTGGYITVASKSATMAGVIARVRAIPDVPAGMIARLESASARLVQIGEASRARGKIADMAFSVYHRLRLKEGLDGGWPALRRYLEVTNTVEGRRLDAAVRPLVDEAFRDAYRAAQGATPDLTKVPKVSELGEWFDTRLKPADLHKHHTVPIYLARGLGIPESAMNDMPGIVLHRTDHLDLGEGSSGFHKLLREKLPPRRNGQPPYSQGLILQELDIAYQRFGRQDVWLVAREWLRQRGIQ